jgi:hypothetical protein
MTEQEETNINWLAMAVSLPTGYMGESCYYDKRDSCFFIITNLDHILIDDSIKACFINNYSEEEESFLVDKLKRLEAESQAIINIPRIGIDERVSMQMGFMARHEGVIYFNSLVNAIAEQDYTTTFVLDKTLSNNVELNSLVDYWWEYKVSQLITPINEFAASYSVDLTTAKLFHIEPSRRSMTKTKQPEPLEADRITDTPTKKAWWKIW